MSRAEALVYFGLFICALTSLAIAVNSIIQNYGASTGFIGLHR